MGLIGNFYGFRGYYNHSRGKTEEALKWYQKAEEHDVTSANYQMAYGVLLLRTGQFDKAEKLFNKLLVFFPGKPKIKTNAKLNLALAHWKQGKLDLALESMTELYHQLKNSQTYGSLGYLLIETGDYEKALKFNQEALEYDDEDPVVLDSLGQTYYRMGDMEKAFEYFKKAQEEKEDQAVTLYYLGILYQKRGQTEKAKEVLDKALTCRISALSTVTREEIEEERKKLD